MNRVSISLLPKQIIFPERALHAQIKEYEEKIAKAEMSEDEISDMQNDLILMKPTLQDLRGIIGKF